MKHDSLTVIQEKGDKDVSITCLVSGTLARQHYYTPTLPPKNGEPDVNNYRYSVKSNVTIDENFQITYSSVAAAELFPGTEKHFITIPDITALMKEKITEID